MQTFGGFLGRVVRGIPRVLVGYDDGDQFLAQKIIGQGKTYGDSFIFCK
jgi:hypothetical protein